MTANTQNMEGKPTTHRESFFVFRAVAVAILLFGITATGLIFLYQIRTAQLVADLTARQQQNLEVARYRFQAELDPLKSDIGYLSTSRMLRTWFAFPTDENRALLAEDFAGFSSNRGIYDQIRLIGADGIEIIRVEGSNGAIRITPVNELQFKGDRYYVAETLKLGPNQIYASPFDLNVEHGKVERPIQPVIRVSAPAFDDRGQVGGAVVINFLGQRLLDGLRELSDGELADLWLLNSDGYWLAGPERYEWAFMYGAGNDLTLQRMYPDFWELATSQQGTGSMVGPSGLFVFAWHAPWGPHEQDTSTQTLATEARQESWLLASFIPRDELDRMAGAIADELKVIGGILGALILGLALISIWHGARRRRAEKSLRAAELRYSNVLHLAHDGIIAIDEDHKITVFNQGAERIFGYTADEVTGSDLDMLLPPGISTEHREHVRGFGRSPIMHRAMSNRRAVHGRRKNGEEFPAEATISKFVIDGKMTFVGVVRDITERRLLEDQFRLAQKLNAVGELSGGIAHDFNNLLAVILGNLQLLAPALDDNARGRQRLDAAVRAVMRGSDLTKRLLAFGRRQMLDPRLLQLNDVLAETEDMLRRTLGEDIDLSFHLASNLWRVRLDAGLLEHALINLCANARDAMPKGGKLTVETANFVHDDKDNAGKLNELPPGRYVTVSVSDSGQGIPLEMQSRVFEPFFTTKGVGEGTGLGLAMVYGFVKQSGGHAIIESSPEEGTVVRLYFPFAEDGDQPVGEEPENCTAAAQRGHETILVVEDDEDVLEVALAALRGAGYHVLTATSGQQALDLLDRHPTIQLLMTDIVMPGGMDGAQLAREARKRLPHLRVLYCSGYAQEALSRTGRLAGGSEFMAKPYGLDALTKRVRQLLDD